jgi:copper transport protein
MRRHFASSARALVLAIVFALSSGWMRALAHAFLLRTDPPDGTVLASAPSQMRFWFSEPLEIHFTTITLQDGNNKVWHLEPHADPTDLSVVIVFLPDLPPNAYRVTWRTVSDEDLHVISGFIVFGIQQPVSREGSGQTQNATSFTETIFHWINLLAFASALGALIVVLFLFRSVKKRINEEQLTALVSLQRKMILSALWFCLIAFIAGLLRIWDKFNGIGATSLQEFIRIDYVRRELVSEACLIVIALLILSWLRASKTTIRNILVFSCAALWMILQAMNSHAAAFNDISIPRILAYVFHVVGAALWMGGQIALILLVAPRLRRSRLEQAALAREVYVQFGYIAAFGVALLTVSGIYSAGQQVASLDALLLTDYGRALILKTIIFLLAGFIGLSHASHFHPKVAAVIRKLTPTLTARPLFRETNPAQTLRIEALGGVAIFLLAAYLGSTQPARGPEFDAPVETDQPTSITSMADDLLVNFSIKPNQPGQNFITVGVFNTRRPAPAPIESVLVKMISPDEQNVFQFNATLSEKEGTYQISTGALDVSGDWKIAVMIKRTGWNDAVLDLPWKVAPAATIAARPTLISNRPLAPLLTIASLLLSILFGGAWLILTLKPDLIYWIDNKVAPPQELYQ